MNVRQDTLAKAERFYREIADGASIKEIADRVHMSRQGVVGILWRCGLPSSARAIRANRQG